MRLHKATLIPALNTLLLLAAPAAESVRPNIVFIMADDHGSQAIGSYGSRTIQTPRIDSLARDGMRFTHACPRNSISKTPPRSGNISISPPTRGK